MATITAPRTDSPREMATGTLTVNAAFLQEIKEVNQELWQLLAELHHRCIRPIAPGQCKTLIDRLSELRDNLALHFALEEAYGYFEDPVHVAPQLSSRVEALRAEHKTLYCEFCRLLEHAERMFYSNQPAELALWIGPHFLRFETSLRGHESREIDVIYEAYDSDLGGSD